MSVTTISGSGTKNNGGTVVGGGNLNTAQWHNLSIANNSTGVINKFTGTYPSWNTGVSALLQSAATALTNVVVQSSSTGFCKLPITSHGFTVGQMVVVIGTDVTGYNQIHRVTSLIDANNVQTDVPYSADATVVGTYKTVSGNFGKMVANQYVAKIIGSYVAGIANSVLRIPGSEYFRVPFNPSRGNHRYNITSWDYVTGRATKGANAGAAMYYHNISSNNDSLQTEPFPTRAVPGHLVYFYGDKDGAVVSNYSQRNA